MDKGKITGFFKPVNQQDNQVGNGESESEEIIDCREFEKDNGF